MVYKIVSGVKECYCDSFITGPSNEPLMVSFYDRSSQLVRSIGTGIILDKKFSVDNRSYTLSDQFEVFYTQIVRGKEKFTHGVAFSTALRENYLVTTPDTHAGGSVLPLDESVQPPTFTGMDGRDSESHDKPWVSVPWI